MTDRVLGPVLIFLQDVIAPNSLWVSMVTLSLFYYQSVEEGGSVTWRTVAVGSMAIIGTLAGLGYREFMSKMKKLETDMRMDRHRRDRQHQANVAAIIALAMAGSDRLKAEEAIGRLLASQD